MTVSPGGERDQRRWWSAAPLAARTPSVSSLTSAVPSGCVMSSLRSWSPMAVAVSGRLSEVRSPVASVDGLLGGVGRETFAGEQLDLVVAGRTRDVVDLDEETRDVVEAEEARRRHRHDHRIADDHVGRGMADGGGAPGHRHDPDGAGEVRHVEGDRGLAVGADLHDARVQGDEDRGRRRVCRDARARRHRPSGSRRQRPAVGSISWP